MQRDYIKFSGKTLEAEGRCALPAFYGVLGLRVFMVLAAIFGTVVFGPSVAQMALDRLPGVF